MRKLMPHKIQTVRWSIIIQSISFSSAMYSLIGLSSRRLCMRAYWKVKNDVFKEDEHQSEIGEIEIQKSVISKKINPSRCIPIEI